MESLRDQNNLQEAFTIMILDPETIYFHVMGVKSSQVPGDINLQNRLV